MVIRAGKRTKYIPTLFWLLIFGIPIVIFIKWFFWWYFYPGYERKQFPEIDAPRGVPKETPEVRDDFRKLKGIGPKTADTLKSAGILTFEQIGLMKTETFMEMLSDLGLPTRNAAFWQDQARLAAAGDWKELEKLQKK